MSQIHEAQHDENSLSNFLCLECLFVFGSAQGGTQGLLPAGQEFYH